MAKPATKSLTFTQGDDVEEFFRMKDRDGNLVDLTDWSGKSQIRDASDNHIAEFVVTINEAVAPSIVALFLGRAITENIPVGDTYKWDLELTRADGFKRTYLSGPVVVNPQVTRDEP